MNPNFWNGKKVFITGHTGFKGSWLSLWLHNLGADVTGFSLPANTQPSHFEEIQLENEISSIIGDIRNFNQIYDAIKAAEPEIIFHLAAQPLVRESYENPIETYSTNVMGTVNLLEVTRRVSTIRAIVNVTSDKCYENNESIWGYREIDVLGGFDPYSNSKACSELVTSSYRASFFNPKQYKTHGVAIASARAGNVIGGGDWSKDRLVPDIFNAFEKEKICFIRNLNAIRPWQFVLEPLRGYLLLAQKLFQEGIEYGEAWNFGPDEDSLKTVDWLINQISNEWGGDNKWSVDLQKNPHEANSLKLDTSKAKSKLNWYPILHLNDAITLTIDWVKGRKKTNNIQELSLNQIINYQKLAINFEQ